MVKECACNEFRVLVHSVLWLAPWFNGVMGGMSDMFLWELYFEYLVPEGACSEAEKYPIY
jgi:hypothetical protein